MHFINEIDIIYTAESNIDNSIGLNFLYIAFVINRNMLEPTDLFVKIHDNTFCSTVEIYHETPQFCIDSTVSKV
jgi:hypothetical protein